LSNSPVQGMLYIVERRNLGLQVPEHTANFEDGEKQKPLLDLRMQNLQKPMSTL